MTIPSEIPLEYKGEITISEVLIEIEKFVEFSIVMCRDSGQQKGSRKFIERVRKGTKRSDSFTKKPTGTTQKYQFKKYDQIPMINLETNQMFTPKFTHILRFNNQKVIHFGA